MISLSPGWVLQAFERVDSTMAAAERILSTGEIREIEEATTPLTGIVILADEQTAGKGRHERQWISPPGNLYCTLLYRPPVSVLHWGELSYLLGLVVMRALMPYLKTPHHLTLKWPNDILLNDKKVSGILLEALSPEWLAIGIGVNLETHPENTTYPATSLRAKKAETPDIETLVEDLVQIFEAAIDDYKMQGFAPVREAWLAHAAFLNLPIEVSVGGRIYQGIFRDLDKIGRLLLETEDGSILGLSSGEVFLLLPPG